MAERFNDQIERLAMTGLINFRNDLPKLQEEVTMVMADGIVNGSEFGYIIQALDVLITDAADVIADLRGLVSEDTIDDVVVKLRNRVGRVLSQLDNLEIVAANGSNVNIRNLQLHRYFEIWARLRSRVDETGATPPDNEAIRLFRAIREHDATRISPELSVFVDAYARQNPRLENTRYESTAPSAFELSSEEIDDLKRLFNFANSVGIQVGSTALLRSDSITRALDRTTFYPGSPADRLSAPTQKLFEDLRTVLSLYNEQDAEYPAIPGDRGFAADYPHIASIEPGTTRSRAAELLDRVNTILDNQRMLLGEAGADTVFSDWAEGIMMMRVGGESLTGFLNRLDRVGPTLADENDLQRVHRERTLWESNVDNITYASTDPNYNANLRRQKREFIQNLDNRVLGHLRRIQELREQQLSQAAEQARRAAELVAQRGSEFGVYKKDIIDGPISAVLDHIVTNDYREEDVQIWRTATETRAEMLKQEGGIIADFGSMLELCTILRMDTLFKKGHSIDVDHLAIIWENAQPCLASQNVIDRYDRLRTSPLYRAFIRPLTDKAEMVMESKKIHIPPPNGPLEKNPWYAGKSEWGTAKALLEYCHQDLLGSNPTYAQNVALIPADRRDDYVKFLEYVAQYDASICDLRTKVAIKLLGHKRAAIKHHKGITAAGKEQPQTFLSKISYKVGKNNDYGKYASALAWIHLPPDLINGDADLEERAEQLPRFGERQNGIDIYIRHHFTSRKAVQEVHKRQWRPTSWDACFPHVDWVLRSPDREPNGKRSTDNNFVHYRQTMESLNSIYDTASSCMAELKEDDFEKLPDIVLYNKVGVLIQKIGTQVAMALAYAHACPDARLKGEIFESMRAAVDLYIISILAQIKLKQPDEISGPISSITKKIPLVKRLHQIRYRRRYGLAKKAIIDYIKSNGSLKFDYKHPVTGEEITFSEHLIQTTKNKAFRKSWKRYPEMQNVNAVLDQGKNLGMKYGQFAVETEELVKPTAWPYVQESSTSVHEEGDKK